jgi:hypothetical protein
MGGHGDKKKKGSEPQRHKKTKIYSILFSLCLRLFVVDFSVFSVSRSLGGLIFRVHPTKRGVAAKHYVIVCQSPRRALSEANEVSLQVASPQAALEGPAVSERALSRTGRRIQARQTLGLRTAVLQSQAE